MPAVRGRRKAAAAPKPVKKTQKTQDIRKSLSVLQPAADDPASLVGYGENLTPQKIKKPEPLLDCKENSPVKARRSKRKAVASNCEKSKVKSSTPVSNDAKNIKSSNVRQQTLTEFSEKLIVQSKENDHANQKESSEHSKASLSGISIPSESSGYFSDLSVRSEGGSVPDTSAEGKLTEFANVDPSLTTKDVCVSPSATLQNTQSVQDVYDLLVSEKVPYSYWREIAEERRLALQEALHENELLHDQVEVMETEIARLRSLVDDAEKLADTVKSILGDS